MKTVLCLTWFLCATAWADVTIKGTHSPGLNGDVQQQVIYLRDEQMRIDQLEVAGEPDSASSSQLIRFNGSPAGLMYIDHEAKRVELLSSLRPAGSTQATAAGSFRVVKNVETRKIMGQTAQRYDFSFSGDVDPLVVLGSQLPEGMAGLVSIKLNVSGTSWVVPGMAGASELAGFFALLTGRHLAFVPRSENSTGTGQPLSLISPELSAALTGVMAEITRSGLPVLTLTTSVMNVDGQGMMVDMMQGVLEASGMGGQHSTESVVSSVSTTELSAELFYNNRLPAGYTLNTPR